MRARVRCTKRIGFFIYFLQLSHTAYYILYEDVRYRITVWKSIILEMNNIPLKLLFFFFNNANGVNNVCFCKELELA